MCATQNKINVVSVAQCSPLSLFSGDISDIIYASLSSCVTTEVCVQVYVARFQALCQDTRVERRKAESPQP